MRSRGWKSSVRRIERTSRRFELLERDDRHVLDKSVHPHRVPIAVTEKTAMADGTPGTRICAKSTCEAKRTVYYVHPEFKMPEESKEQLEDAVESGARAWEFKGDGLGMSDGHGTFRYYRNLGQERLLKFARRRASV